ncbi:translation initiation factor IF-1A [Sulfolobales archaeon HS-7]|nr:translation initiation factor IF-1A [Sulfolobales archaeon HS-7]
MAKKRGESSSREPVRPAEGEVICVVKKMLGGEHLILLCLDGKQRQGRIPGRLKKRVWINEGDVVLASPWDFQLDKCDVVHKYSNDELKKLEEEKIVDRTVIDQLRD